MAIRHHKTKKQAMNSLKAITPKSYGTPNRKLIKKCWKTKNGWSSSVRPKGY